MFHSHIKEWKVLMVIRKGLIPWDESFRSISISFVGLWSGGQYPPLQSSTRVCEKRTHENWEAWVEEEITKRDKNARRKGPWKMEDWLHQGLMMVMREEKSLSKIKNNNNKNLDQISTFPTTREGGGQKMKRLRHQTIKCLWLAVKSSGIFLLDSRAIIHVNHLQKTHHPKYSLL